jgi:Asp-tRNA(Asn)/Glu-tRNA(Gln) amidotransferase A subunit family amidase
VPLAIGTQTGASTTRPASYCGIAALTLGAGRFPMEGVPSISPSIDRHGIFAASVSDVALAWSVLSGRPDVGEPGGRPPRLLVWTGGALGVVSDEMAGKLGQAVGLIEAAGAVVAPFPREHLAVELRDAYDPVHNLEVRTERARELAIADQIGPRWVQLRAASEAATAESYAHAKQVAAAGLAEVTSALSEYDAIVGPAATGAAPAGLAFTGDPAMSIAWQLTGLPAVAVPGLRDRAGLPLGLQTIALDEETALRTGAWIERQLDGVAP